MSGHTPGPWTVGGEAYPMVWPASDTHRAGKHICQPTNAADARLIAAAPEMYAVVEEMAGTSLGRPEDPDEVANAIRVFNIIRGKARAALAKVSGK